MIYLFLKEWIGNIFSFWCKLKIVIVPKNIDIYDKSSYLKKKSHAQKFLVSQ